MDCPVEGFILFCAVRVGNGNTGAHGKTNEKAYKQMVNKCGGAYGA